jgi:hypothetical protein
MIRVRQLRVSRSCVFALLFLALTGSECAHGQTLTVSAAPSTVNFTLPRNGVSSGDSTITITTSWLVSLPPLTITLYAFTSSTTSALTDGAGHNIPTSKVSGSANGGAFSAFTSNSTFGPGRSLTIFTQTSLNVAGSRNDTLGLQVDTTSLALPPATYHGTLTIRATLM